MRQQHVGEQRVGELDERRGGARGALDVLVARVLASDPRCSFARARRAAFGAAGTPSGAVSSLSRPMRLRQTRARRRQLRRRSRRDRPTAIFSAASVARGRGEIERDVERRAFLLLAHDAQALALGGAEIEAVRLPFPRHAIGRRRPSPDGGPDIAASTAASVSSAALIAAASVARAASGRRRPRSGRRRSAAARRAARRAPAPARRRASCTSVMRAQQRERALKLRLRVEPAAAVERAEAGGLPRGRRVHRRRADADALERQHQHAVARERAERDAARRRDRRVGGAEHALAERELIETVAALRARRPGRWPRPATPRRSDPRRRCAAGRPASSGRSLPAEDARPEAARRGRGRRAVGGRPRRATASSPRS